MDRNAAVFYVTVFVNIFVIHGGLDEHLLSMSSSLNPWIAHYLLDVAEVHGGNLTAIPPHSGGRKAQIIKFLTYGTKTAIWAELSDASYKLPVKFTIDAVDECERQRRRRFTEISPMIVTVKNFKPIFTRVPKGNNLGMSLNSSLVLECRQVSVLGACGEACFGNPKEIETNSDLRLWSSELRKDGGGANILRDRKRKLEQVASESKVDADPQDLQKQPPVSQSNPIQQTRKPVLVESEKQLHRLRGPPKEIRLILNDLPIHGDLPSAPVISTSSPMRTPGRKTRHEPLLLLGGTSKSGASKGTRSRSATPISSWSPTPNPVNSSPARHDEDNPLESKTSATSGLIDVPSSIPAPTPAQRARPSPAPQSSPVPFSSLPVDESLLSARNANTRASPFLQREVQRRVPLPLPKSVIHGDGPPLVLVPNSDTSVTASQSIPLSQSQSQSQPQKGSKYYPEDEEEPEDQRTNDLAPELSSQDEVYDGDQSSPERFDKLRLHKKVAFKRTHSKKSLPKPEMNEEKQTTRVVKVLDEDDAQTDLQLFGSKGRVDRARCDPVQHDAKVWEGPSFLQTNKNSGVDSVGLLLGGINNKGMLGKYPWPTRTEYEDIVLRAKGKLS